MYLLEPLYLASIVASKVLQIILPLINKALRITTAEIPEKRIAMNSFAHCADGAPSPNLQIFSAFVTTV